MKHFVNKLFLLGVVQNLLNEKLKDGSEDGEMWPLVGNKNVALDYNATESISNYSVPSNPIFITRVHDNAGGTHLDIS